MAACVAHSAGKGQPCPGHAGTGSTALLPASPKLPRWPGWVSLSLSPSRPCRHPSVVRGGTGLPPVDRLLQFLVDSSADSEEDVQCANCDRCCTKAVRAAGWTGGVGKGPLPGPCMPPAVSPHTGAGHHVLLQHLRAASLCPVP